MAKVRWIKVWTDMYDNEKIKLIDTLPERDTIHYIWMRLLVQAAKTNSNGDIFLSEDMPYTEDMLSVIFNRPIDSIKLALKTLKNFKMIDIDDANIVKVSNWSTYQNVEGMDKLREDTRKRVAAFRKRQKDKMEKKAVEKAKKKQAKEEERNKNLKLAAEKMNNKIKQVDRKYEVIKNDIEDKEQQKITEESIELLSYYERFLGRIGVFDLESIKVAIAKYGEELVRKAIDRAIEVNKASMRYVNGILRNWGNEGSPSEERSYFNINNFKSNYSEYEGFKPQEPRMLSDEERERAEVELI